MTGFPNLSESMKWDYCPECGCEEVWCDYHEMICVDCGQKWDPEQDYSEIVRENLFRLFRS